MAYRVVVIKTGGLVLAETMVKSPDLAKLQELVAGYIQEVPGFSQFRFNGEYLSRGRAYCDEEGKLKSAQYNPVATALWHAQLSYALQDKLCGTVVYVAKVPS